MKIDKQNYQQLMDAYEAGELEGRLCNELEQFLEENPDLIPESAIENPALEARPLPDTSLKERLKRSEFDDPSVFEEYAITLAEGDLSSDSVQAFIRWLKKNASAAAAADVYTRLKLEPDLSIGFPDRIKLKREATTPLFPMIWRVVSVAAVLVIAWVVFWPKDKGITPDVSSFVEQEMVMNEPTVLPEVLITIDKKMKAAVAVPLEVHAVIVENYEPEPKHEVAPQRGPVELPAFLLPLDGKITSPQHQNELLAMNYPIVDTQANEISVSKMLQKGLKAYKKDKENKIKPLDYLVISGLQLVAQASGKRLKGHVNENGEVHAIEYDSRVLAFSIPIGNKTE